MTNQQRWFFRIYALTGLACALAVGVYFGHLNARPAAPAEVDQMTLSVAKQLSDAGTIVPDYSYSDPGILNRTIHHWTSDSDEHLGKGHVWHGGPRPAVGGPFLRSYGDFANLTIWGYPQGYKWYSTAYGKPRFALHHGIVMYADGGDLYFNAATPGAKSDPIPDYVTSVWFDPAMCFVGEKDGIHVDFLDSDYCKRKFWPQTYQELR